MVHPNPTGSSRRTHAQRDESGGTDSSAQSTGSESGSSTTQAASEVARTLVDLVAGESGGPIKKVFSYLKMSDASALASVNTELSNPRYRAEIPYTFAPPLELIPELMPDPQNPTVKPAAWNRVIPGFTRFRAPEGTTDAQLGALIDSGWLNAVTHWDLRACNQLTDAGLAHLARLPSLEHLNVAGCNQLTDAGLAHLARLPSLEHLNVAGCNQLTNAGLAHIANLTGLKSLNLLGCTQITVQGWGPLLVQLPNLERLDVRFSPPTQDIPDPQLRALIDIRLFNAVTYWDFQGCDQLTDAGLAHLALLPSLEHLNVAGCNQFTDAGLAHIANLTGLKSLNLLGCNRITTQGLLTLLAQLPNLERLEARFRLPPDTTDAQLGALIDSGRLNAVTRCDLRGCNQLTDAGLAHLARLPSLEHLNVAGCNQFTDTGLAHIANLTGLKSLDLTDCNQFTDASPLAQLTGLEVLNLGVYQEGAGPHINNFAFLRLLPNLESLNVHGCEIKDRDLIHFDQLSKLRILNLHNNYLTDTGFANLVAQSPNLERLYLGNSHTNAASLMRLSRLPNLEHLDIRGCDLITNALLPRLRASHPNLVVQM